VSDARTRSLKFPWLPGTGRLWLGVIHWAFVRFRPKVLVLAALAFAIPAYADGPLLHEYVREVLLARQASDEMQKTGGAVVDGRVSPWFSVLQRATRMMCVLSARLKLNPRARLHSRSVARQVNQPPNYYDFMRQDRDDNGAA
jgi:phage terminase small subunit